MGRKVRPDSKGIATATAASADSQAAETEGETRLKGDCDIRVRFPVARAGLTEGETRLKGDCDSARTAARCHIVAPTEGETRLKGDCDTRKRRPAERRCGRRKVRPDSKGIATAQSNAGDRSSRVDGR